jgi:hypothetical protein
MYPSTPSKEKGEEEKVVKAGQAERAKEDEEERGEKEEKEVAVEATPTPVPNQKNGPVISLLLTGPAHSVMIATSLTRVATPSRGAPPLVCALSFLWQSTRVHQRRAVVWFSGVHPFRQTCLA